MKNGIYIETINGAVFNEWTNCEVHYKDDKIFCIKFTDGEIRYFKPAKEIKKLFIHRLDGPARIMPNGEALWYLDGKYIPVLNQQEFEKYMIREVFK